MSAVIFVMCWIHRGLTEWTVGVCSMFQGHRVQKSVTSRRHNLVAIFDSCNLITVSRLLTPALHELVL